MFDYQNPLARFLLSKGELESWGQTFDCDFVWRPEDFFTSHGYSEAEFIGILNFLRWAQKQNYSVGLEKTDYASKQQLRSLFRQAGHEPAPFKEVSILMPGDMTGKVIGVYIASNVPSELPFKRTQDWTLRDIHSSMFIGGKVHHWNRTAEDWNRLKTADHATPMPIQG